ncbi:MAG TPA: hypothetical protein PKU97_20735, partial [Kofleriaceae bacterium]|nr:hypothetical protein [Kofleriaceae bacterium]
MSGNLEMDTDIPGQPRRIVRLAATAIAAGVGDNSIQHARQIQGLGKVQMFVQRDRLARHQRLAEG